jgi:hypothetical protein
MAATHLRSSCSRSTHARLRRSWLQAASAAREYPRDHVESTLARALRYSGIVRVLALFASLLLDACGRVGFDPLGGGDGDVMVMADARVCVTGPDSCNAVDDDCDGLLDEDCLCFPFDRTSPVTYQLADHPGLTWTGDGYGIAAISGGQLVLRRLLYDGTDALPDTPIGTAGAGPTELVYTGAGFTLAWRDATGTATLSFVDRAGARVANDRSLGFVDEGPYLAWSGTGVGVVSLATGFPTEFSIFGPSGGPAGGGGALTSNFPLRFNAWDGTQFLAGMREPTNARKALYYDWNDTTQGGLGSLRNPGGTRVGFVDARTNGYAGVRATALIDNNGVVLFQHDLPGATIGSEQIVSALPQMTAVSLAWSGSSFVVVAREDQTGDRMHVIRADANAALVSTEILPPVAMAHTMGAPTVITAGNGRVAAAWIQQQAATTELVVIQRCY